MVLTAYSGLSSATNSSCHRRRRIKVRRTRSGRLASAGLTPATGARTTRLCRPRSAVRLARTDIAHRSPQTGNRPCDFESAPDAISVHRIPPRVRDDRETPLEWGETAGDIDLIWVGREAEYFRRQDWTGQITLMPLDKLSFTDDVEARAANNRRNSSSGFTSKRTARGWPRRPR